MMKDRSHLRLIVIGYARNDDRKCLALLDCVVSQVPASRVAVSLGLPRQTVSRWRREFFFALRTMRPRIEAVSQSMTSDE
jgi:hypothetical protein